MNTLDILHEHLIIYNDCLYWTWTWHIIFMTNSTLELFATWKLYFVCAMKIYSIQLNHYGGLSPRKRLFNTKSVCTICNYTNNLGHLHYLNCSNKKNIHHSFITNKILSSYIFIYQPSLVESVEKCLFGKKRYTGNSNITQSDL